ncbi:MAG TPA: YkvA family protein [Xanthobacteraceae bacterium]|nr:YkvA family protein [Xanthobacteraceae bacterium]
MDEAGDIDGIDATPDPAAVAADEAVVRRGFWRKLRANAARLPFADDLLAAYYCAFDPATPFRVRGALLGALAYFVMPLDMVPDFVAGLGYTDDAAVLLGTLNLLSTHIRARHRKAARRTLAALAK